MRKCDITKAFDHIHYKIVDVLTLNTSDADPDPLHLAGSGSTISKGGSEDPDPLLRKGGSKDPFPDSIFPNVDPGIRIHAK